MAWQTLMYDLIYRRGTPRWETGTIPAALHNLVEGEQALPPGRALDIGCGTGAHAVYLARLGWEVTGVDFSATAIRGARSRAVDTRGVNFVEGDVTRLIDCGVDGPFDLLLDVGCYHGIPGARRPAYVREMARVMRPGAHLLLWAIDVDRRFPLPALPTSSEREVRRRFAPCFTVVSAQPGSIFTEASGMTRWPSAWYVMRRSSAPCEPRARGEERVVADIH
jgi:SAM-dependent methyltransferase